MSNNTKPSPKTLCRRHPRRIMPSKLNVTPCSNTKSENPGRRNRSRSTGTLDNISNIAKPRKTTKSECIVNKPSVAPKPNCCHACGDAKYAARKNNSNVYISTAGARSSGGVQQYFRNRNFRHSSASVQGVESSKKVSNLNTIRELSEENSRNTSKLFVTEPDGKTASLDIEDIKRFRRENYFECHSAAAKLNGSVHLRDHRCVYRFYLNERLFPVPVDADYNHVVRCTECQLPLKRHGSDNISGTIQAKVKMNGRLQDVTLMLPVRNSLVVKERRRAADKTEEVLYFGIVQLGQAGGSGFGGWRSDSLALRHQKGYQEFGNRTREYEYERVQHDDVIVI